MQKPDNPTARGDTVDVKKNAKIVAVNDRGQRIGESHPRAVLTDREVDLMLALRDEGYSYAWLARKFEVSKGCVWKICVGRRRAQVAVAVRRVRVR